MKVVESVSTIGLELSIAAHLWEKGLLDQYIEELATAEKQARERRR